MLVLVGVKTEDVSGVKVKVGNGAPPLDGAAAAASPFQFCSEELTTVSGDNVLGAVFDR